MEASAVVEHLGQLVGAFPSITMLTVTKCKGDQDVALIAALPALSSIVHLDLYRSNVGDRGVQALAESDHLGKLRVLELWSNQVGRAGCQALARSDRLPSLWHLNLWDNPLDELSLLALMQSGAFGKLHWLDIQDPERFVNLLREQQKENRRIDEDVPLSRLRVINGNRYDSDLRFMQ